VGGKLNKCTLYSCACANLCIFACRRQIFRFICEKQGQIDQLWGRGKGLYFNACQLCKSCRSVSCCNVQEQGKLDRWPSGITIQILGCRAQSRGSVRLQGPSVTDKPAIDLAYCTDPDGQDARTLREGIKIARKLTASSVFADVLEPEEHPGAGVKSDSDIDAYMRKTLHSGNALVGTCALGHEGEGVVSPDDLSVHGVEGLRVVDSSVVPRIPGGQTGAVTVMIAERAARMLTQGKSSVASVAPATQLAVA
jgi:choline dehydrogenase-like flavoprotein